MNSEGKHFHICLKKTCLKPRLKPLVFHSLPCVNRALVSKYFKAEYCVDLGGGGGQEGANITVSEHKFQRCDRGITGILIVYGVCGRWAGGGGGEQSSTLKANSPHTRLFVTVPIVFLVFIVTARCVDFRRDLLNDLNFEYLQIENLLGTMLVKQFWKKRN